MAWSETRCPPHPLHPHHLQLCADLKGLWTTRPQKGLEHCTLNTETQKEQSWAEGTGWLQCLRAYDESLPLQGTQVPSQSTLAPPPSSSCSSTENPRALSPPQSCGHPRASRFLLPQTPPQKHPASSLRLWLHLQEHPGSSPQNSNLTSLHMGWACVALIKVQGAPSSASLHPRNWMGGGGIEAHCHLAGGVPGRTAAASTGFGSAYWTCMKMKWSSSRPHPTRSFSGLREAAGRWVQTAFQTTPDLLAQTSHPAQIPLSACITAGYL